MQDMSMQQEAAPEQNSDALDIQVAGSLVAAGLISDEGLRALMQVLKGAQDPAMAIGNAVFMAISKVREKLDQNGMSVNDKLWMAKGGILDRVLFEVVGVVKAVLGFEAAGSPQFAQAVKQAVVSLMQQESAQVGAVDAPQARQPVQSPLMGAM